MISVGHAILIAFTHWVADFICQTDKMSQNKGKSVYWLSIHVLIYATVTTLGWAFFTLTPLILFQIFIFTFISHWCTDFVTSKITGYLYLKNEIHWFFVVIGIDQFIHTSTLLLTYTHLIN